MSKDSSNKKRDKDRIEVESIKHTANYTVDQMLENLGKGEPPKTEQELLNKLYGGRGITTKAVLTASDDFNTEEWEHALEIQGADLYKIIGMNEETLIMLEDILKFYFIGIDDSIRYCHDEIRRLDDFRQEMLGKVDTTQFVNKPRYKNQDIVKEKILKAHSTKKDSTADAVINSSLKKY